MGTRTAIFKEQEDGTFQGIYIALDGGIANTGVTLIEHYDSPEKTQELIDQKTPLRGLGAENQTIETERNRELSDAYSADLKRYQKEFFDDALPYATTYVDSEFEGEYFTAQNLEEIRNFDYLTLNKNEEIQGFDELLVRPKNNWSLSKEGGWVRNPTTLEKIPFRPYRGSDNNGFLYAQKLDGTWLVSKFDNRTNGQRMTEFKPLRPEVQRVLHEAGLKISSDHVLQDSALLKELEKQESQKTQQENLSLENSNEKESEIMMENNWQVKFSQQLTDETSHQLEAEVLDSGRGELEIKGLNSVFEDSERYDVTRESGQEQLLRDLENYQDYANTTNGVQPIDGSLRTLKSQVHEKDYRQELVYYYGGTDQPEYIGTVGEILDSPEKRKYVDNGTNIEELQSYVTSNVKDGGWYQKDDITGDLYINPTKSDLQKVNVKVFGQNQNENLDNFTREKQVTRIAEKLLEKQLDGDENTKSQYYVKPDFDSKEDGIAQISILKYGDKDRAEHGKLRIDLAQNNFNVDSNNDNLIHQKTVKGLANVIKQVNPAQDYQKLTYRPQSNTKEIGR